jgi:hypothetical protein
MQFSNNEAHFTTLINYQAFQVQEREIGVWSRNRDRFVTIPNRLFRYNNVRSEFGREIEFGL